MKTLKFAVLPGDGIGPEVMAVALRVLGQVGARFGFDLDTEEADIGGIAIDRQGHAFPEPTQAACQAADAILFGSVGGPRWESLPPPDQPERASLLPIRKLFALYANIRPGLLYAEIADASPLKRERVPEGIDIVCIRELTGGIYFGDKSTTTLADGQVQAVDTMVYTTGEIERIARVAIDTAMSREGRVCSVDKANVLECSVLWRNVVSDYFAAHAPQIELSHMYVDNAAMQLARDPNQFDVLLTENMFGDILSDEMGVICGSLGMLASASLGARENRLGRPFGLYEPSGGTAPDIAGRGIANPCAQILSAALMLRHSFGEEAAAAAIETAVKAAVAAGVRTPDIAFGLEAVGSEGMGEAVIAHLD